MYICICTYNDIYIYIYTYIGLFSATVQASPGLPPASRRSWLGFDLLVWFDTAWQRAGVIEAPNCDVACRRARYAHVRCKHVMGVARCHCCYYYYYYYYYY